MSSSGYAPQLKNWSPSPKSNAPCSPFFIATYSGPIFRMRRPALMRLVSFVISRASLSFKIRRLTRRSSASRSGLAVSIHRSMVSATTKRGRFIWSSTCACSDGAMLASKTKSVSRYVSGSTGLKCSKTLSAIERVSRVFRSHEYSPDQRNVFPFARCTPSVSILRDFQNSNSDSGKSSPTTPTNRTGEKKLAASAPYDADPPNNSECSSTGVLTVSIAMEPTTRTDIWKRLNCYKRYKVKTVPLCEHIGRTARVINDAVRVEQGGNHRNALCSGVDHTL